MGKDMRTKVPEIDWSQVEALVDDYVTYVGSESYNCDRASKLEMELVDVVVEAVYGPEIWDFINERIK